MSDADYMIDHRGDPNALWIGFKDHPTAYGLVIRAVDRRLVVVGIGRPDEADIERGRQLAEEHGW